MLLAYWRKLLTALDGYWCVGRRKPRNYLAFIQLACAKLIFFKITVYG
jgi:hypothetical protein